MSYTIIMVSDIARAVAFYRDAVGIPLRFETPDWSEFATDDATLALHLADPAVANGDGGKLIAGRCRPGLRVRNLDAFHDSMMARSVVCTQTPQLVFGARVAQYADPDGLTFSVSEGD